MMDSDIQDLVWIVIKIIIVIQSSSWLILFKKIVILIYLWKGENPQGWVDHWTSRLQTLHAEQWWQVLVRVDLYLASSSCYLPCYVPRVLLQVLHAAQALEPHLGRGLPPQLASHQEEEHVNTWSTNLPTTIEHLWSSNAKTNPRRVFIEDTWMYRLKPLESLSTVEHFSLSDKPTSNLFRFCFSKSHFLIWPFL